MIFLEVIIYLIILPAIIHEIGHILLLLALSTPFKIEIKLLKIELNYEISIQNWYKIFFITIFGSIFNLITIFLIIVLKIDNPYLFIGSLLGACSIFLGISEDHKTLLKLFEK